METSIIPATYDLPPYEGLHLHHVGLVVKELDNPLANLTQETTVPFNDTTQKVTVQFVRVADGTFIELIKAQPGSPVGAFLGLHHLAFEVPDLIPALLAAREWAIPVGRPFVGFERRDLAFVMPRQGAKLLIELVGPAPAQ